MKNLNFKRFALLFVLAIICHFYLIAQPVPYYYSEAGLSREIVADVMPSLVHADTSTQKLLVAISENEVFPEKIFTLTNLEVLILNRTMHSGAPNIKTLPSEINSLTKLQHLALHNLEIENFPSDLSGLKELKTFRFHNSDVDAISLPDFSSFPQLNTCNIILTKKTGIGSHPNFNSLLNSRTLEKLTLINCKLQDANLADFSNLDSLQYLDLSNNDIKDLSFLTNTRSLKVIRLTDNNITAIPAELFNLEELVYLELSGNAIEEISSDIKKLRNLEVLILNGTKISSIPKEIAELPNLRTFSANGTAISEVPVELFNLQFLSELSLLGTNIERVPDEIANSNIRDLSVSNKVLNKFEFDADILAKMKRLKMVGLSNFKAEKKLQKEKTKLRQLRPDVSVF